MKKQISIEKYGLIQIDLGNKVARGHRLFSLYLAGEENPSVVDYKGCKWVSYYLSILGLLLQIKWIRNLYSNLVEIKIRIWILAYGFSKIRIQI